MFRERFVLFLGRTVSAQSITGWGRLPVQKSIAGSNSKSLAPHAFDYQNPRREDSISYIHILVVLFTTFPIPPFMRHSPGPPRTVSFL